MNLKTNPNDSIFMDGNGMTKREFFAGSALTGVMAAYGKLFDGKGFDGGFLKRVSNISVEVADAVIDRLNGESNDQQNS